MLKEAFKGTVILIMIFAFVSRTVVAEQEKAPFENLVPGADAVVVVEILSTDYSATPADGDMVAVAKVLKVLKGPLRKNKKLRFTETAWVGPTYKAGEYRILFLETPKPSGDSRLKHWRILSHLYAKADFFIEKDSIPDLSLKSLDSVLQKVQNLGTKPNKIIINKDTMK